MVRGDQGRNPLEKIRFKPEKNWKIEALRSSLAKLDVYERDGAPLSMRFGLYSGSRIYREKLLPIYYSAIEQRYKKPILKKLQADLVSFSQGKNAGQGSPNAAQIEVLDKNFNLFQAYLMLSKEQVNAKLPALGNYRDHAEPTTLFNTLKPYILTEAKVPEALAEVANQQLEFYFQQVKREDFPGITLDANLVDSSRKQLQAYPAWAQYYKRVTSEINNKVPSVSIDTILAGKGGGQGVLFAGYTVPGAYTVEGYKKYMIEAVNKASEELNKDDWVMGGNSEKGQVDPQAVKNIEEKYFKDYINHWKKLIASASVVDYKQDKNTAIDALEKFSDVNSPLKNFLEDIARQTNLSATPANQTWTEYFWNLFQSKKTDQNEKTPVEMEFDPLFKFTESKEGAPSEITNYGTKLKAILTCSAPACNISKLDLAEITNQVQKKEGAFVDNLNRVEKDVDSFAGKFNSGTVGPDISVLIKKPLGNLLDLVGGGIKDKLTKDWGSIFAAAQKVEKGYPFSNDGDAFNLN